MRRFWSKVDIGSPRECWVWRSGRTTLGYGHFYLHRGAVYAHRLSFELHHQISIPAAACVLHTCNNRLCCNPDHLFLGYPKDPIQPMRHMYEPGYRATAEDQIESSLPGAQVQEIKLLRRVRDAKGKYKYTIRQIARLYGVDISTIQLIMYRRTYS